MCADLVNTRNAGLRRNLIERQTKAPPSATEDLLVRWHTHIGDDVIQDMDGSAKPSHRWARWRRSISRLRAFPCCVASRRHSTALTVARQNGGLLSVLDHGPVGSAMKKRGRKQKDRPKAVSLCWRRGTAVSDQVHEHGRAGVLSLGERSKRRATDLYGAPVLIDRTPGCHEAENSTKAGTVAALKTDYERKTVAARVPYLQIHRTDDAGVRRGPLAPRTMQRR